MKKKKVLCSVGTRPEAIKMAPVIQALKKTSWAEVVVLATAQHRDLLDQMLNLFEIRADRDLSIMRPNQSLHELTARLIQKLDQVLVEEQPDVVLAQGDTTTVFCTALSCYYRKIPFGHVEAGLRSFNKHYPFPEEMNRVLAGHLADIHFVPTERARKNLLQEGVPDKRIHLTGNTVIDALFQMTSRDLPDIPYLMEGQRLILVTAHRRENFGQPLREICTALRQLAEEFPDLSILYPVHPNPNVKSMVEEILSGHPRIHLPAPLEYDEFVAAMKNAYLILTDSGGVQEEAPALGKPVLVLRDETERPEAIEAGGVLLVGPHRDKIVLEAGKLLRDDQAYQKMAQPVFPYGDGKAAERIISALATFLNL